MASPTTPPFDNREFRERFLAKRQNPLSLNNRLDSPTMLSMMGPNLRNLRVLEIGCGAGDLALEMSRRGLSHYVGIDISREMIALAVAQLKGTTCKFKCADIEHHDFGANEYDVVVSALTFHFLQNLPQLLTRISAALAPNGRLIFSMRHPLRTSNPQGIQSDKRGWVVRGYFDEGPRSIQWHEQQMTIFHRTFSSMFSAITKAGLIVTDVVEAPAQNGSILVDDQDHVEIPGFIFFKCVTSSR